MTQWQVSAGSATQIVAAGDPETLIVNKNTKYSILIGNDTAVGTGTLSDATPLGPYESLVVNGLADVFAVAAAQGTTCLVIAQTNAILWTPKAVQPNIEDSHAPYSTGVGTNSVTLNVPPGAQGLFVSWPASSATSFTLLRVVGIQSGVQYYSQNPRNLPNVEAWIPILSDADTTVTVTTTTGANVVLALVWLMNSFMAGAVSTGMSMDVNLANVEVGGGSVPVTATIPFDVVETAPEMWANSKPISINASIAASGTVNVLPASPGHSYYLHEMRIEPVTGAGLDVNIQDTTGTNLAILFQEVVGTPVNAFRPSYGPVNFHGAPVGVGLGVQINNPTGATQQYVGYLTYSLV